MTEHTTLEARTVRLTAVGWSRILPAQARRTLHTRQGHVCHVGVALRNRMNQQGLWTAGFTVARDWGDLSSHGRMWLACLNNSLAWKGTETHYPRKVGAAPGSLDSEGCLTREPHLLKTGDGDLQGGCSKPSLSLQMSRQNIISDLGILLSTVYMHKDTGSVKIEDRIQDVTKFSSYLWNAASGDSKEIFKGNLN